MSQDLDAFHQGWEYKSNQLQGPTSKHKRAWGSRCHNFIFSCLDIWVFQNKVIGKLQCVVMLTWICFFLCSLDCEWFGESQWAMGTKLAFSLLLRLRKHTPHDIPSAGCYISVVDCADFYKMAQMNQYSQMWNTGRIPKHNKYSIWFTNRMFYGFNKKCLLDVFFFLNGVMTQYESRVHLAVASTRRLT